MSNQPSEKEKTYCNFIIENIAFSNITASWKELLINAGKTKNKILVGYTEGLFKSTGNELSIDYGYKEDLNLEDRCSLIKEMNELMSKVAEDELGYSVPGLRYEAIVNKAARNCKVYRHTDYSTLNAQEELARIDKELAGRGMCKYNIV
jgi:hypothetical protein